MDFIKVLTLNPMVKLYLQHLKLKSVSPAGVAGAPDGRRVLAFTEKPDAATAAAYLAAGDYRWNAGMFVACAGVLLDHLAARRPALAAGVEAIAAAEYLCHLHRYVVQELRTMQDDIAYL